uniref:Uncharacterized protein n=1 Tax=Oryza barthii TaxID=65489 RepID=A0A0D3F3Y0_9ORYZ
MPYTDIDFSYVSCAACCAPFPTKILDPNASTSFAAPSKSKGLAAVARGGFLGRLLLPINKSSIAKTNSIREPSSVDVLLTTETLTLLSIPAPLALGNLVQSVLLTPIAPLEPTPEDVAVTAVRAMAEWGCASTSSRSEVDS